ncbi:hypothetical protein RK643_04285 [Streptococcus pneumoniae]|nr:hypothetical protein [Streptococcus pneumoniae]
MTGVSNPTTDSARLVLAEQGLRDILQTVKDAIASLESIKESQSATKDGGQTAGKETAGEDESANQTQEISQGIK